MAPDSSRQRRFVKRHQKHVVLTLLVNFNYPATALKVTDWETGHVYTSTNGHIFGLYVTSTGFPNTKN